MSSRYAFENKLRGPYEFLVSITALSFASLCVLRHEMLALDIEYGIGAAMPFLILGLVRAYQGVKLLAYQKQLLVLKPFQMAVNEIPVSKKSLYTGRGFEWRKVHRQRMELFKLPENECYLRKGALYRWVQQQAKEEKAYAALLQKLPPFKPVPNIQGKPWLHGVGAEEEANVYLPQYDRASHELILGTTGVGKTCLMSLRVAQDIRGGEAVCIIDPKGTLDTLRDVYSAAKACGRLDDLQICHLGFPQISARYNPLSSYSEVSEVAERITGAIDASGEGKQFKEFAWKYVNITARCLAEIGIKITYKSIAFFVMRPELLLLKYADTLLPPKDENYLGGVKKIIKNEGCSRAEAIVEYLRQYIEQQVSQNSIHALVNDVAVDLYNAAALDKTYYQKITISIGPVLDKINQGAAAEIFSDQPALGLPEIRLNDVVKRKRIVYIGLNSLGDAEVASGVGQAIIADLVSLCGRLYNQAQKANLCLYCDEFNNIVRDRFIDLLNKARGAGVKVCALTQTINDIGAAFGSNQDKAHMIVGNFGTVTCLRVKGESTAKAFTTCLEMIKVRNAVPSTMSNDRSDNKDELFSSYNTDTVSEQEGLIIEPEYLLKLPKGQAFVMTFGGELYKLRIPLPKNDNSAPESFEMILNEVNLC